METFKFWSFLLFLVTQSFRGQAILKDDLATKYAANDDIEKFFRVMSAVDNEYGRSWIVMEDGNGTAQYAVLKERRAGIRLFAPWTLSEVEEHSFFILFTRDSSGTVFNLRNISGITFDGSKKTKVIIHGWRSSTESDVFTSIRDAYLKEQDANVIGVDWSHIAGDYFYPNAAEATKLVGEYGGRMIDALVDHFDSSYSDFHLIGHSLGAHVAGFMGSTTKGPIKRITGLDPALPDFQYVKSKEGRLDPTDAEFVDIIHTCSGVLGISVPNGHVDFFPNGGTPFQPGCAQEILPPHSQACSHSRSIKFFAESISSDQFLGVKCLDFEHFRENLCEDQYAVMGEKIDPETKGVFYLRTKAQFPFAAGILGASATDNGTSRNSGFF